ncbi:MAG TPA: glutaredoxin family protein [Pyrinomonadaceae bacterium]|nr:glutaredoxin family protein [Pyrinomonadaceae bacterium]
MDETQDNGDALKAQVVLYTRPRCHLCDEAKQAMRAARCEGQYTLREVNIDLDPELKRRYGWDIPVILIDGVETFKHRLTASEFEREIRRALSR